MELVASVSHELRTPITAILCAGENVRDGFAQGREGLVEQGSIIINQAAQLADIVDQFLRFAAITAKPQYTLQSVQVSEILDRALRNTMVEIQKSGFTVEQQVEPGLPMVLGDLQTLSHCLQNLIVNAVKYSARGRWIGLFASMDTLATGRKEVRISVQDRGPGISRSELARIFEPFYRSPRVVAAQIHGTGLGLSIAKSTIEALGGSLSVVSEVGVGSMFTLHVPVSQASAPTETLESAASPERLQHEGEYTAGR
jgi:signal transduction histidine kinase